MSTTLAPTTNPFDIERLLDGSGFAVIDTRDNRVVDYTDGRDAAQSEADRLWYAELKTIIASVAVEPQTPEDAEIAAFWRDYDAKRAVADPEYAAWVGAPAAVEPTQGNRLWNSDLGEYEDVEVIIGRDGQQLAKSYGYSA